MQVVGKCERSGAREFRLENTRGHETLCFFRVKWPSVIAEGGSLFPRFRGSIGESGRQKVHETVARVRFPFAAVGGSPYIAILFNV